MSPRSKDPASRNQQPTPLSEAIENMFAAYELKDKADRQTVIALWPQIMGTTIASRTSRLLFKGKVLYVELTSAPLRQELTAAKDKILQLLSEKVAPGVVEDIVFR